MVTISEGAFAKVNLTLDVLGKREDGYHNIKSIMQTISLHDDVTVDIGTGAPWQVHCYREVLDETGRENPTTTLVTEGYPQDEKNLAWKAAKAYYAATKLPEEGLEIFISKRIPMQAGLAGGSADAAAVLRVLNRHYGYPLSLPALCELGSLVGLGCAVLCDAGHCAGRGRGQQAHEASRRTGDVLCRLQAGVLGFHARAL